MLKELTKEEAIQKLIDGANKNKKLKQLVQSYKDSSKWIELDVIDQLIPYYFLDESEIPTNIRIRYQVDGNLYLNKVKEDLANIGITSYEDISRARSECSLYPIYGADFERILRERIKLLEPKFKHLINMFACNSPSAYDCPYWSVDGLSWAMNMSKQEVEKKLIEIGLINHDWYKSNRFNYPVWRIPGYVIVTLRTIREFPEIYGITRFDTDKIRELAREDDVRAFVEWVVDNRYFRVLDGIPLFVDVSKVQGANLEKVIGKLISSGALVFRGIEQANDNKPDLCSFYLANELLTSIQLEEEVNGEEVIK